MEKELQIVLSNTYTADDAYRRISLAKQFIEQTFFSATPSTEDWRLSLEKFLVAYGGQPALRAALAAWGEQWFKSFERENINEKFAALERAIDELSDLTIIVPTALPPAEVSRLGQWARENVDPEVLVALRTDPEAVGGCIIIWQGLYIDMSMRYFFTKHRDALIELVRSK
jgi:hypothetical protein